jgi:uncharacterized protein (TIGR02118 family)
MKRIIVHYGMPDDPAAFDAHYEKTHIPLTSAMPHLRSFEVSRGDVSCSDEARPVYLTAILSYESAADMEASLASEEGKTAVADVANFATGGVTLVTIDTEELL